MTRLEELQGAGCASGNDRRSHGRSNVVQRCAIGVGIGMLLAVAGLAQSAPRTSASGLPGDCHCGLLSVRGGTVLVEQNADRLYTPASVQKLIVSAAALHLLGPEFRVVTEVWGGLPDEQGTLDGDLLVVGHGDPTWNEHHFEEDSRLPIRSVAEALKKRGVRRILGDLVIDGSAFPGRETPPDWPVGDLSFRYGAVPSALAIERNSVELRMAPGARVGAPVIASVEEPIELLNLATTAAADRHGKGTIEFQMLWDRPTVVMRGEFPITEAAFRIQVATPQPLWVAGNAFAEVLREEGIDFAGAVRIAGPEDASATEMLARVHSPPLVDWLEPLLADSDNWYAEMLLRVIALEVTGAGRLDSGLDIESDFLVDVVGVDPLHFDLDDASGLSPFNLLSPRAVVRLLEWALHQPWFEVYETALASDRHGTLSRSWGQVPALRAKTGSLTHVQTLAGYDRSLPGPPTVFAVFSNDRKAPRWRMKRDILAEIRAWRPLARAVSSPTTQVTE